ncbi:ABC transporter permease [Candidatus Bipolaricaulota bacterium]|nr:ABC transporter permease [Candidatus Bipolaricaulota bacterium]
MTKSLFKRLRRRPELGAVVAFAVLFLIFSGLSPRFATLNNLSGVLTLTAELGIMTIGISFLMIAGEFDLSVSSVYAMGGFLYVILVNALDFPLGAIIAFVLAISFGAVIGFINGMITLRAGIPSFITTLGMLMFLRGLLVGITGGSSVVITEDSIINEVLTDYFFLKFRPSHLWFLGIIVLFTIILTKTTYGNHVLATGGNKKVARTMGVNVEWVKIKNFMASGMLAAFAGTIAINRFSLANAAFGQQMELEAIASAVIGGTLMTGGYGTVIGAAFGASIMGMVRSGLVLVGAPSYWYQAFVGAILIIAATINLKLSGLKS